MGSAWLRAGCLVQKSGDLRRVRRARGRSACPYRRIGQERRGGPAVRPGGRLRPALMTVGRARRRSCQYRACQRGRRRDQPFDLHESDPAPVRTWDANDLENRLRPRGGNPPYWVAVATAAAWLEMLVARAGSVPGLDAVGQFQAINISTVRTNLAASWNRKSWPASGYISSLAPGTLLASCRTLAGTMN